ncbi:MAG: hypothetical protein J6M18_04720 [Actinomycetaceae bacterium]|nr:hypothetical protein [Actinomycetaceae bacterium]
MNNNEHNNTPSTQRNFSPSHLPPQHDNNSYQQHGDTSYAQTEFFHTPLTPSTEQQSASFSSPSPSHQRINTEEIPSYSPTYAPAPHNSTYYGTNSQVPYTQQSQAPVTYEQYSTQHTEDTSHRGLTAVFIFLTIIALALGGFLGYSYFYNGSLSAISSDEPSSSSSQSGDSGTTKKSEDEHDIDLPSSAYSGAAKKELPANATLLTMTGSIDIATKSGNIRCFGDVASTTIECYVKEWGNTNETNHTIKLYKDKKASITSGQSKDTSATELDYNTVYYAGDWCFYVVHSGSNAGLTAWNIKTGHGAIIRKAGWEGF